MSRFQTRAKRRNWALVAAGAAALTLSGCESFEGGKLFGAKSNEVSKASTDTGSLGTSSVRLVERDVEAPDVFQATDKGLWDGRPSLGGVWVAHPDVKDPERVIIRNTSNGKFVIGALFRRERANPGPVLQVSSDAAAALGMLAGAPDQLNVTALRREAAPESAAEPAPEAEAIASAEIEETTLDPIAGAAAAIDDAEGTQIASAAPVRAPAAPAATAATAPAAKPATATATATATAPAAARTASSGLKKPYLQIGIFSVEQNASNTATAMRQAGMVPTVLAQESSGKKFWRVIVGPATSGSERSTLLKKIKGIGFDDAYAVTN